MNKKLLFFLLLAFLIRLIALNQSLWLDEAVTAQVVKNLNFIKIITQFSPTDFHPPLYYLLMKLWTNIFGYSEIALRIPSVLFSLGAGYIIFLMAGIWGAAFFLFNPLIVYYSQEARMYTMATFFLTAGLYFFIRILGAQKLIINPPAGGQNDISKIKNLLFLNLSLTLAFYTFYGSIFLIAPIILYFLIKKEYKYFILNTLYLIIIILLISPLLYTQLINSKMALINVKNWGLVLGKANLKDLLLIPVKFSIGRIDFYPKWIYYSIAGIWTGFVLYSAFVKTSADKQNNNLKFKNIYLFYYLFIFTLILGFIISFSVPMLQYFRFIYLIPIMAILLAFNKNRLINSVLLTGFVVFSLVYLLMPQFHREDWKSLANSLPKDIPLYMIKTSSDPLTYYLPNLKVNDLTSLMIDGLANEITIVPYTTEIYGLNYKSFLAKDGYRLERIASFRNLTYERWVK